MVLMTTFALVLCLQLVAQTSGASELPGSYCYQSGGIYHGCDTGRCCSTYGYCGSDSDHCATYCWSQCHADVVTGQRRLDTVNATYNEFYDRRNDNISSSSSSSSCATTTTTSPSSEDIPTAAIRNKYAPAAFRRPASSHAAKNSTTTTTTYCGQCLKLTNLESGAEAMVRIVHEHNTEGIELDRGTFNKLRSYGPGNEDEDHHHLVLKYQFQDCQG